MVDADAIDDRRAIIDAEYIYLVDTVKTQIPKKTLTTPYVYICFQIFRIKKQKTKIIAAAEASCDKNNQEMVTGETERLLSCNKSM